MSLGVDDGSGPLPLGSAQQATSSTAGLQDSVAEAREAVRERETEKKMFSAHIVILRRCLREKTFTHDDFTIDALGDDVADYFDTAQPSEDAIRAVITKLEDWLKKAEEDLSTALKTLEYAMAKDAQLQPYNLDDLAKAAEEAEQATPDTLSMKEVIGRDAFFAALLSTARNVQDGKSLHETKALVLACGSGVGKTFGTQTARKGFQHQDKEKEYKPVVAYLGFNSMAKLSGGEERSLKARNRDAVTCMRVLIYCRLFAWLNAYTRLSGPEQLDGKGSDVQQQFKLPTLTEGQLQRVEVDVLIQRVEQMLTDLGNKQRNLVLIAVVDEGQLLDAETPRDVSGKVQGARLALRCLRELQHTMGTQVRVVPVCTGIDPALSLSSQTEGQNISLDKVQEALLGIAEFESLLQKIIRPGTAEDKDNVRIFASFTWPRVRGVMRMANEERFIFRSDAIALQWTAPMNVRQVVQAAADGMYLDEGTVPVNMARLVDSEGRSRPLLEFGVLWSVAKKLGCVYHQIPESVSLHELSKQKWGVFESNAFRTLVLFLRFFYHKRESNIFLPEKESTRTLREWIPLSAQQVVCTKALDNEQGNLHPFTQSKDKLSEEFSALLRSLQNVGDTFLVHCCGSAPLDFILVTLEEDKTLQVRYADAKFRQNTTNADRNISTSMCTKAHNVHTSLRKCLKNLNNFKKWSLARWKPNNFLLITNSQMEGGCVMSPLTTTWEPMTTLLYRSTGTEEVVEDEEEEDEEEEDEEEDEESQVTSTNSNAGDGGAGSRKRTLAGTTESDPKRRCLSGGS